MIQQIALSIILALAGRHHERELQRRLRERQIRWREFEEE